MRFKPLLLAAALVVAPLAAPMTAWAQATPDIEPPVFKSAKIVLIGDSTTAVQGGWGPSFCGRHVTSFVACINLARGGRSSGNYRTEGSWKLAMYEIKSGGFSDTYVLIQFGHNDQPGQAGTFDGPGHRVPGQSEALCGRGPQRRRQAGAGHAPDATPVQGRQACR